MRPKIDNEGPEKTNLNLLGRKHLNNGIEVDSIGMFKYK